MTSRPQASDEQDEAATAALRELLTPPGSAVHVDFDDVEQLAAVRGAATSMGRRARLSDERIHDLVLAVSELASNSIQHGGGRGQLTIWQANGHVVCQVRDSGQFAKQLPLRPPAPGLPRGRGLWLVLRTCDAVHRVSGVDGTTTQVVIGER